MNAITDYTPTGELKIGTIIVYDLGYSMTLPHFAIIESFTPSGKSARIREMSTNFIPDDRYGQTGYKVPVAPTGEIKTCRIKKDYVAVDGHWSREWNGRPERYDTMD